MAANEPAALKSCRKGTVITVAVSPSPGVADITAVSRTRFTLGAGAGAAEARRERRERGMRVETGKIIFVSLGVGDGMRGR